MQKCQDPILCYRDVNNGKRQFRHWTLASPIFKLKAQTVFNCRKCQFCRKKQAYELAIRCVLNASLYKDNCFITLTYDETQSDYENTLQYQHIQKFKKKLRRWVHYHYGIRIQIFNVHEYGRQGKKHWHLVIFGYDFKDKTLFTVKKGNQLYTSQQLSKLWKFGHHTIGAVTEASAMYQAQYMQKDAKNGNLLNDKKSKSNHSAIGRDYFLKHYKQILSLGFIPVGGRKVPIPRYFIKIAHKHYSYFNEPENFEDTPFRKKIHNKFRLDDKNALQPDEELSESYKCYITEREKYLEQVIAEWEHEVAQYINTNEKPDFIKSAENYEYDFNNNKNHSNQF